MIQNKKELKEWLTLERTIYAGGVSRFSPIMVTESQILRRHITLLRKTEYYKNTGKRLLYLLHYTLLCRFQNKYCLHIPLNVCGKGLSISHVGPIIIHGKCIIGENLRINVGVNIGANGGDPPKLGNNIYIGPGAKIFGDITIADNVRIGANAVVNKSCMESGATLVGVPACIK